MIKMSKTELAYFAGIIDGEGTISVSKNHNSGYNGYSVVFRVYNTNKEVLNWIKNKTNMDGVKLSPVSKGSSTWNRPNIKPLWKWQTHANGMREILPLVIPYMIIKKRIAELTLEFLSLSKQPSSMINKKDQIKRNNIYLKLRKLNKRGLSL
jgi:hypothetical protein